MFVLFPLVVFVMFLRSNNLTHGEGGQHNFSKEIMSEIGLVV